MKPPSEINCIDFIRNHITFLSFYVNVVVLRFKFIEGKSRYEHSFEHSLSMSRPCLKMNKTKGRLERTFNITKTPAAVKQSLSHLETPICFIVLFQQLYWDLLPQRVGHERRTLGPMLGVYPLQLTDHNTGIGLHPFGKEEEISVLLSLKISTQWISGGVTFLVESWSSINLPNSTLSINLRPESTSLKLL